MIPSSTMRHGTRWVYETDFLPSAWCLLGPCTPDWTARASSGFDGLPRTCIRVSESGPRADGGLEGVEAMCTSSGLWLVAIVAVRRARCVRLQRGGWREKAASCAAFLT